MPDGLPAEQHGSWAVRLQLAQNALAVFCDESPEPDATIVGHLQDYVDQHISMGQAVGRIVDHHVRTGAGGGPLRTPIQPAER